MKISILLTPPCNGIAEQEAELNRILNEDIEQKRKDGFQFDSLTVLQELENGVIKFAVVYHQGLPDYEA